MIYCVNNNIFELIVDAVVNPVNCVGVMGKGLALQFKNKFPKYYNDYKTKCNLNQIKLGGVDFFPDVNYYISKGIFSFPTKFHWRNNSNIEDIKSGLIDLKNKMELNKINRIAIPKIGCGLGGLNWDDVKPLIIETFKDSGTYQVIYIIDL